MNNLVGALFVGVITATKLTSVQEVTKLIVEVSRHGARASETIYPFTVNPEDNF